MTEPKVALTVSGVNVFPFWPTAMMWVALAAVDVVVVLWARTTGRARRAVRNFIWIVDEKERGN